MSAVCVRSIIFDSEFFPRVKTEQLQVWKRSFSAWRSIFIFLNVLHCEPKATLFCISSAAPENVQRSDEPCSPTSVRCCCSLMKSEQIAQVLLFDIYSTYCKSGRRSSVRCLRLAGDGANWTKTVFHCGLTGSCESIYSLTAMRQNGLWNRQRRAEAWEN